MTAAPQTNSTYPPPYKQSLYIYTHSSETSTTPPLDNTHTYTHIYIPFGHRQQQQQQRAISHFFHSLSRSQLRAQPPRARGEELGHTARAGLSLSTYIYIHTYTHVCIELRGEAALSLSLSFTICPQSNYTCAAAAAVASLGSSLCRRDAIIIVSSPRG